MANTRPKRAAKTAALEALKSGGAKPAPAAANTKKPRSPAKKTTAKKPTAKKPTSKKSAAAGKPKAAGVKKATTPKIQNKNAVIAAIEKAKGSTGKRVGNVPEDPTPNPQGRSGSVVERVSNAVDAIWGRAGSEPAGNRGRSKSPAKKKSV